MSELTKIPTMQGKVKIAMDGYLFIFNGVNKRDSVKRWKCADYKNRDILEYLEGCSYNIKVNL